MKFDWDNWSTGGRIIFVATSVAALSMFMNWVDIGITSRIGLSQEAFLLLGFWIYPIVMLFSNKPINLAWGLLCATLSFIVTSIYMVNKTIELLGETINTTAVGAWVFLCASIALGVGVVKHATDGVDESENKINLRPLGTVLPIIFLIPGLLLLGHWFIFPDWKTSTIEPVVGLLLIGLSIGLWLLFGEGGRQSIVRIPHVSNTTPESNITSTDKDDTLKVSLFSMVLGFLSILGLGAAGSINNFNFVSIVISGTLFAAISGLVLGVVNIKSKQGVSKRMSITGIAMSSMVLAFLLLAYMSAF